MNDNSEPELHNHESHNNDSQNICNTVITNVSGRNMDCDEIIHNLMKARVQCHVETNKSVRCKGDECWVENGCTITSSVYTKDESLKAWEVAKKTDRVECAHICIPGKFSGCAKDWERDSLCKDLD